MKRVLLINSNIEIFPYPVAPLGIALVATSIKKEYNVKVFDAAYSTENDLLQIIEDFKPDYIGISIRNIDNVTMRKCTWYLEDIKTTIVDPIKKHFNIPIPNIFEGVDISEEAFADKTIQ